MLEALGGPDERHPRARRQPSFGAAIAAPLNVRRRSRSWPAPDAACPAAGAGLDDALFEHDGQITKREVRAVTLAALAPRRGELLWDIGAGAGSVAIEWMLRHPSLRAVAVEARPDRAARIRRNAAALGVPGLEVVEGAAPGGARRACPRPTRSSSAAAAPIRACSTRRSPRCGRAGGWSRTR